jgi:hypothetical protein
MRFRASGALAHPNPLFDGEKPQKTGIMYQTHPLELRMEISKRLSNACFDFLKRLSDQRSIVERYLASEIDLHVHFLTSFGMKCATYRKIKRGELSISDRIKHDGDPSLDRGEFAVFVFVREIAERSRPIASVVRLQTLDSCDMGGIESLEPTSLNPSLESISRVFDQKLRSLLLDAGRVTPRKLKNKIFERSSKIITNLSNPNSDGHWCEYTNRDHTPDVVQRILLELGENSIVLFPNKNGDALPEIRKVFVCPRYSLKSAVERMRCHEGAVSLARPMDRAEWRSHPG